MAVRGIRRQDQAGLLAPDDVDELELGLAILPQPAVGQIEHFAEARARGSRPPSPTPACASRRPRACPSRRASGPRCRTSGRTPLHRMRVPPHVSSTSSACAAMARTSTGIRLSFLRLALGSEVHDDRPLRGPRGRRARELQGFPAVGEQRDERRIHALGGRSPGSGASSPAAGALLRGLIAALGRLADLHLRAARVGTRSCAARFRRRRSGSGRGLPARGTARAASPRSPGPDCR